MSAQMHVISGFVGAAPETREVETQRGKQSVTTLNLAINNPRDREAEPTWYRVTMWNGLGKAVQPYVDTGSYLVVTSDRLSVSTWLNQDNEPQATLEITALSVDFSANKRGNGDNENTPV
jgi:single-strand DNA-binding protein